MEKEKTQIELRSEKVRNIIGQVPPMLLRYGISIIGLAICVLVCISAIISYQPTIDTELEILQDDADKIHFTAKIMQQAMDKQAQFAYIEINPASEIPLPQRYIIQSISDTIQIFDTNICHTATLQPTEKIFQTIELQNDIILPAKIILKKRSVLMWILSKIN